VGQAVHFVPHAAELRHSKCVAVATPAPGRAAVLTRWVVVRKAYSAAYCDEVGEDMNVCEWLDLERVAARSLRVCPVTRW
jgi:hypothetical protein